MSDLRFGIAVFCVSAFTVLVAYLLDRWTNPDACKPLPPVVVLLMFGIIGMACMVLVALGYVVYVALGRVMS